LAELKKRNDELEKERMANVPMDTAKEIKNLQNKIVSYLSVTSIFKNKLDTGFEAFCWFVFCKLRIVASDFFESAHSRHFWAVL
jgi:hypothetical protein